MTDQERMAELTAQAIRSTADDAAKQADAFIKSASDTATAISGDAEKMVQSVKDSLDKTLGVLRSDLRIINDELRTRSEELANRCDAFIRHCSESLDQIKTHHSKINGGAAPRELDILEKEIMPKVVLKGPREEKDQ